MRDVSSPRAAMGSSMTSCQSTIGMVSGKILRFDRRTVDSAGQFLARSRRTIERGYGRPDGPEYDREGENSPACRGKEGR